MSKVDFQVLIDDTSQHQISVNTREYIAFLTRLGITFSVDIQLWLEKHQDLYFFTVYQAVHAFTKALMFNDLKTLNYSYGCYSANECDCIVENFNEQQWQRVVKSITLYFNYLKFTQWDVLYHWIICNPVNTKMLNNIKTLLIEEKEQTEKFKQELQQSSLEKILQISS